MRLFLILCLFVSPMFAVDCGSDTERPSCSGCGFGAENCGGECHWIDESEVCVHDDGI